LVDLLRLPTPERMGAAAAQTELQEADVDFFKLGWALRYNWLKNVADIFFSHEGLLVQTYNKTKHGAPMVQLTEPENPRRFEFVVTVAGATGDDRYQLAAFNLEPKLIAKLSNNVSSITTSITELASLARILLRLGLLYERDDESSLPGIP
jgi:hypothetical protein